MQRQTAVTAHFLSKQLRPFVFRMRVYMLYDQKLEHKIICHKSKGELFYAMET